MIVFRLIRRRHGTSRDALGPVPEIEHVEHVISVVFECFESRRYASVDRVSLSLSR